MTIPSVIEAKNISTGINEPHGIVYTIRKKVSKDVVLNHAFPSTNYP